ncbi:DUF2497 domain-containing protein [Devosia rhodophyticola]|uniref:DUF2497 domain-containing protein n=1 Tax=Devosia rhodophyticola TaxID=3026423 RepID=A0ABY7YWK4_9HYPH|nr:DUF2497 domain-containing protein [Devosia rhodophyticola]WDR05748.1 DUF2497 domain-containing protein [Devosia rhodophyticola]
MNKPATKEPSMDEILSSIRQIIADDDAAGAPRKPVLQAAPPPMQATPARTQITDDADDGFDEMEPLALSSAQMLPEQEPEVPSGGGGLSFDDILADAEDEDEETVDVAGLVEPDDIGFEADPEPEAEPEIARAPVSEPEPVVAVPEPEPEPIMERSAEPAPIPTVELVQPAPQQARATEKAPPMPDATLSRDMAEQLVEPATNAAVRSTFARLNNLGLGAQGVTIESIMRDMLRPMLKEWLDENLPSVVERMVEKEIARVSRGE